MTITFRNLFLQADFDLYSPLAPEQQNLANGEWLERKSCTPNAAPTPINLNTSGCGQN